jgi:hypothetical protein
MSKNSITKKYLINGPNNIARLTDGKKIIYIFSDFHLKMNEQTACLYNKKHETIDIDKFLIKFFHKETKKEFDIFIEVEGGQDTQRHYMQIEKFNDPYLHQVRKILHKEHFNPDDTNKNKVIKSNNFPNIRFHFFDFRFRILPELNFNFFYDLKLPNIFPYIIQDIVYLNNLLPELIYNLRSSLDFLLSNKNKTYLNKIKNKYSNDNIKRKINNIFDIIIIKVIEENIIICENILNYIKSNQDKIMMKNQTIEESIEIYKPILIGLSKLDNKLLCPYTGLTDLYLIRRILDKKYTTNNIIYTGAYHFSEIIYLLVNQFDFKVTNMYHNTYNGDINKFLNSIDINENYYDILSKYFDNTDEYGNIIQCSNMFNFPDNFK